MILVPYPNRDNPDFLINLQQIKMVVIRPSCCKYCVDILTHNNNESYRLSSHETQEEAQNALKEFYEWLTDIINQ